MMEQRQFRTGHVALAFLAGAAAGAVTVYFTSPRNGRENREALLRSARDLRTRAVTGVSHAKERLGRAAHAARVAFAEESAGHNGEPASSSS